MAGNTELDALGKVHQLALRGSIGLLKLPVRMVGRTAGAMLLWLGEEFRRWTGIAVAGLMIFLFGKAVLNYAPLPAKKQLVMITLVLVAIWSLVAFRAAWFTLHNSLIKVQQRKAFRDLAADVKGTRRDLRDRLSDGAAKAARGTPFEGAFRTNRDRLEQEQAATQAAHEQAEAQRQAAEERERRLDEMTALEPNPYETQPR